MTPAPLDFPAPNGADTSVERLLAKTIAERDRARCLATALESIAAEAFALLWETVGDQPSHVAEAALGRRIARFLRENAADAGPDRLPVPQGWSA